MTNNKSIPHNLIMENRKKLRISGVRDIDGFTENKIIINTVMGELVIKGEELHIEILDAQDGECSINGEISSIVYSRSSTLDNPVKKLFR